MTRIDFFALSRAIQDRLIDSFEARYEPRPILASHGRRPTIPMWIAIGGAAAFLVLVLYRTGFGDAESALALQPIGMVIVYASLGACVAVAAVSAMVWQERYRALPFRQGIYAFGTNVIDAREQWLRVYPLEELTDVSVEGSAVVLRFSDARFVFRLPDAEQVGQAREAIEASRVGVRDADERVRTKLDPLHSPAVTGPFAPETPLARSVPVWERRRWVIGIAIGAALGSGLWRARNVLSDRKMLAAAKAVDDVAAYKAYLARGRAHRDLVALELLPRAELRVAMKQGSVDAIRAFIRDYPSTAIPTEIDAARRAAFRLEFDRARREGTLSALLAFSAKNPDNGLGAELAQARHGLYLAALSRYRAEIPPGSEGVGEFAARLIAYSERAGAKQTPQGLRGPTVQIRFQRLPSDTLSKADNVIAKSPMFNGTISLITRYTDAAACEKHEVAAAQAIAERFSAAFAPEVLGFAPGPPLTDPPGDTPNVTEPTIIVAYHVEWSGMAFAVKKPRGIFVGLTYIFEPAFVIPSDSKPAKHKLAFIETVPRDILVDHSSDPPGERTLEPALYEAMSHEAFGKFSSGYLGKWLKTVDKTTETKPTATP